MPRKPLSEVEKDRVRRRACEAAMRLVKSQGVAALTIRSVAREISMSAMSLYTYFENKSDLLAYIQADALLALAERQEAAAETVNGAEPTLRALAQDFEDYAHTQTQNFLIAFRNDEDGAMLPDMVRVQLDRAMEPLIRVVEELSKALRMEEDPHETARMIWSAWYGYAALTLAGAFPAGSRPDIETMAMKGVLNKASPAGGKRGGDLMAAPAG